MTPPMRRGRSAVWEASKLPGVSARRRRFRSPSGRGMTARSPRSPPGRKGGTDPAKPPGRKGGTGPVMRAGTGPERRAGTASGRKGGIGLATQAMRWIGTAVLGVRGSDATQRGGARGRIGLVTAAAVSGTLGAGTGTETLAASRGIGTQAVTGQRSDSARMRGAGASQLLRSCLRVTTEAAGKQSWMWSEGRRVAAGKAPPS